MKHRESSQPLTNSIQNDPYAQRERMLKLMALQVVGHLPSNQADAHRVLAMAARVIDGFLVPGSQMGTI